MDDKPLPMPLGGPPPPATSARWPVYAFLFVILVNLFVYSPAFLQVARSDQLVYLANTSQVKGPALITQFYSYDRMPREFNSVQSAFLFRPLLMAFLGLEKWLWGNNFVFWQVTGFLLHLWVAWNLYRLLLRLKNSFWAVFPVLFYSTLCIGSEMVTWHHVSGYLIYIALMLVLLRFLVEITEHKRLSNRQTVQMGICLLAASFLYEVGFLVGILIFLYLNFVVRPYREGEKPLALWVLLVPSLLYLVCSLSDFLGHAYQLPGRSSTAAADVPFLTLRYWGYLGAAIYWWVAGGLFPFLAEPFLLQRTVFIVPHPDVLWRDFVSSGLAIKLLFLNSVLWLIGALALAGRARQALSDKQGPFRWFTAVLLFLHIGVITVGRLSAAGIDVKLQDNAYYSSFFWIFAIVLFYSLVATQEGFRHGRILVIIFITCWINIIIANASINWSFNKDRRDHDLLAYAIVNDIEHNLHRPPDGRAFSFKIEPEGCCTLNWIRRSHDPTRRSYNYFELLYLDHYNAVSPRCTYHIQGGMFLKENCK